MKAWVKAAAIRAIKTAAQTAVALIGTNAIGITTVDWAAVASAAALAAVVSVLTSVAGIPEVKDGVSPLLKEGE
jgi:conserved domain protein